MIPRPFALVGFSFVFSLILLCTIGVNACVVAACAVGAILLATFVRRLPERAVYAVCALSVLAACIGFVCNEKLDYSYALRCVGDDLRIEATVTDIDFSSSGTYYTLDTVRIGDAQTDCKILLFVKEDKGVSIGDSVSVSGDVRKIGQDDESHNYYKSKRIFLVCQSGEIVGIKKAANLPIRYYIRLATDKVSQTVMKFVGGDSGSLAVSMLTGDKSLLDNQTDNEFKACGLSHTLAVSGLHMNIIVLALYKFVSGILPKYRRLSAGLCIPVAWLYAALSGFSVSAVRACVMINVMLAGMLISRRSDSLNSLGLAALIITLINPYAVMDWSFMLSFSSTLGIVLFAPMLEKAGAYIRNKVRLKFVSGLAVSVFETVGVSCVATAFTLPITILFVGSFSSVFVPANLAVFFAVPIFMVAAVFTAAFGLLGDSLPAEAVAFVCRLAGNYLLKITEALSQPAVSRVMVDTFEFKLWLAIVLVVVAFSVYLFKRRKRAYTFCSLFVCLSLIVTGVYCAAENKGKVTVTAVDVEDGACFVVSYGTSAVLIGCSGDEYVVGNVLDELGVICIELAVVPRLTDERDCCLTNLTQRYELQQTVVYSGCRFKGLPSDTVESDSFSYDFHGRKISYMSDGNYDYCTLDSDAGNALFLFGADTPRSLVYDCKADFLFSRAQPPLWTDTSVYRAVIISAGGNTVTDNAETYSTYENSDFSLCFNEWGGYKIKLL